MEYEMYNHELMHVGVKGMRWGHRKDPYSGYNRIPRPGAVARKAGSVAKRAGTAAAKKAGSTAKKAGKAAASYARKKAEEKRNRPVTSKTLKKVSAESLSDEDLKKAIDRLKKEKEYNALIKELNPQKTSAGKEAVKKFKDEMPGKLSKELSDQLSRELVSFAVKGVFNSTGNNKKNDNNKKSKGNKKDEKWQKDQRKRAMGRYLEGDIVDRKTLNKEMRQIKRDGNEESRQKRLVREKVIKEIMGKPMPKEDEKKKED